MKWSADSDLFMDSLVPGKGKKQGKDYKSWSKMNLWFLKNHDVLYSGKVLIS